MCYNLACADYAAICYYSAETTESGRQILETTMCLDSAENVLQKETKRRSNVVGSEFSTKHVLPFKNQNWIGSGDVPETAAEVFLKNDNASPAAGTEDAAEN